MRKEDRLTATDGVGVGVGGVGGGVGWYPAQHGLKQKRRCRAPILRWSLGSSAAVCAAVGAAADAGDDSVESGQSERLRGRRQPRRVRPSMATSSAATAHATSPLRATSAYAVRTQCGRQCSVRNCVSAPWLHLCRRHGEE